MTLRTCRSCWGTVMADTGRTSTRKIGETVLILRWYRCQVCFALSGELEHNNRETSAPTSESDALIDQSEPVKPS